VALIAGLVIVAVGAHTLWYVYGAWPVPAGYEFPRHSLWGGDQAASSKESSSRRMAGEPVVRAVGVEIRMGQRVAMGGGWGYRDDWDGIVGSVAGSHCHEPFFLSTGVVD
jgi:hypothetical protein